MVIGDFPNQATTGARPTSCLTRVGRYAVGFTQFEDQGVLTNMPVETAVKRWVIDFVNLTSAEADGHDAHAELAKIGENGSHNTFSFTHPTTGVTFSGCRYDKGGYTENPHKIVSAQSRTVILVQYPA